MADLILYKHDTTVSDLYQGHFAATNAENADLSAACREASGDQHQAPSEPAHH
jgi:hypothetical protein